MTWEVPSHSPFPGRPPGRGRRRCPRRCDRRPGRQPDQHTLAGHLPHGPRSELAVGGAPYISGLRPLPDASPPAQQQLLWRHSSPSGFSAHATTTWADALPPPPPPLTSSALVTAIATIQATVEASRERAMSVALTT
jgi:hypothetical protein